MQKSSLSTTKNVFITGTLLLTIAGVLTRIIGFFYRIFLSRLIGAEGLGIYQLVSPVMALGFAVTAAGIQTSISKFVSTEIGKKNPAGAGTYLSIGLIISLLLSTLAGFFIWGNASFIAASWLGDVRCAPLLRVLSFSFVPSCVHACINGYYYGVKKTAVPSLCQLVEQLARVGSVYLMYQICLAEGRTFSLSMTIWGIVIGEAASTLVSVSCYRSIFPQNPRKDSRFESRQTFSAGNFRRAASQADHSQQFFSRWISSIHRNSQPHFARGKSTYSAAFYRSTYLKNLLTMAVPLTANRVVLNLFAAFENIMIPNRLKLFGYTNSEALSVYGILTGMAMAIIMFPSVITNSISVLLLPTISEAEASGDVRLIKSTIRKTIESCLILGFLCTGGFLLVGRAAGNFLFENALAGTFIVTLGWLCPFLYLSSTLSSILHGLGFPSITFALNLIACGIRICFVLFAVPIYGIKSYLIGMLVSQVVIALLAILVLNKKVNILL